MIAIIDYGMGNTKSVYNAFKLLGEDIILTDNKKELEIANALVLPGVGSFSDGMKNLHERNLVEPLNELVINQKKPYLGICLGLEFLANHSFEGGTKTQGFGWIDGEIKKIQTNDKNLKIPHMGWDDTKFIKNNMLLNELESPIFYYLHSYFFDVTKSEQECITSICNYGGTEITSTIQKENIFAVQFHPEKSQEVGLKLLKNFIDGIHVKK